MTPRIILVNENDEQIGITTKQLAHEKGLLHRAFSIFILRKQDNSPEILLQRRQQSKYHCGGLWTNTCCSHPPPGVPTIEAAKKRLQFEMGFTTSLKAIGSFTYKANFDNGLIEHEFDHVLMGYTQLPSISVNTQEVMDHQWITITRAQTHSKKYPNNYTPWFPQALEILLSYLKH